MRPLRFGATAYPRHCVSSTKIKLIYSYPCALRRGTKSYTALTNNWSMHLSVMHADVVLRAPWNRHLSQCTNLLNTF